MRYFALVCILFTPALAFGQPGEEVPQPPIAVFARPNPFDIPVDLSTPYKGLLFKLGQLPSPDSSLSVAFTPAICREMTIKAIRFGWYQDAIALANHGLKYEAIPDREFLYLRAYCEIVLGQRDEATETIKILKSRGDIPRWVIEKVNGPAAVFLLQAYYVL